MIEKAIKKLKNEISKNNKNPYIKVIGEFLIQYLNNNSEAADKILQEDKTIAKSLDAMKQFARSNAVGGYAMLTDNEGYEIVLKYFGINGQVSITPVTPVEVKSESEVKSVEKDNDFNVSLDDFI